jgi:predicted MFS family arabinose efflux permease
MCTLIGYKGVTQIFVGVGLLLAALTYFLVPDIKESPSKRNVWSNIKTVFTNKRVVFICLCAGLMLGPLEGFADVWGTAFLGQIYGFEGKTASYLPSIIYVGMCVGAPFLGYIAEKTGYYLGVIIACGLVMLLVFAGLVGGVLDLSTMGVGFGLVGVCCAYQILAIYKASTYVSEDVAGLTTAAANMIIMFFGSAFHTVIGFIIKAFGGPQVSAALIYGVGVIPGALILGVIGFSVISYQEKKGSKRPLACAQATT